MSRSLTIMVSCLGKILSLMLVFNYVSCEAFLSKANAQANQKSNHLTNRILQEAPSQWIEYSQKAKQLQGSCFLQQSHYPDNYRMRFQVEIKRNGGDRVLIINQIETERDKRRRKSFEVYCLNPDYGFVLGRKEVSQPWILNALVDYKNQPGHEDKNKVEGFDSDQVVVNHLVAVFEERLIDIFHNPQFHLINSREVQVDGENLIELSFDYSHQTKPRESPMQGGILVLDPQRFWCIRSFNVRTTSSNGGQGTWSHKIVELGEVEGSFPVPKRAVFLNESVSADGKRYKQNWDYEFDLHFPRKLPKEAEFTLSAFGLPEPPGFDRPIRWHLWLGLLGIACLSLGAYLRYKKRRAMAG